MQRAAPDATVELSNVGFGISVDDPPLLDPDIASADFLLSCIHRQKRMAQTIPIITRMTRIITIIKVVWSSEPSVEGRNVPGPVGGGLTQVITLRIGSNVQPVRSTVPGCVVDAVGIVVGLLVEGSRVGTGVAGESVGDFEGVKEGAPVG